MTTISKYWEKLNESHNALMEEYGYENFKASVGRIYNDDMDYEKVLKSIEVLWEMLYAQIPEELLKRFEEPIIGNPPILLCNGRRVSIDLGCSIREYYLLSQYIDFDKIKTIVEIGGGYGRLPYVITQMHPDIEYIMCDIEPSLGLAKRYLSDVLPGNKIEYITPDKLNAKCDLVIAANCLHEMVKEQVDKYFNYVNDNAKYFYYSCWKDTTIPLDLIKWTQKDYPVRKEWIKLLSQDHIRQDFFEELYKI
jgi:putative sugar O-methyltransferase